MNILTRIFLSKLGRCKYQVDSKTIFLSFDDGPSPIATPFVLDLLKKHKAKATFFCLGKNIELYPDLFKRIIDEGHITANHSFSHYNGWETKNSKYVDDVIQSQRFFSNNLFRPPYGKIAPFQYLRLRKKFRFIFWTYLVKDYDIHMQPEVEFNRLKKYTSSGSIIVFHDSESAFSRTSQILPRFMEHCSGLGYSFESIH